MRQSTRRLHRAEKDPKRAGSKLRYADVSFSQRANPCPFLEETTNTISEIKYSNIMIRINTQSDIEDTVFIDVADSYVPSFPQIMQLSDKDINAIKSILETARKKSDFTMAETAMNKIKSHLKIESNMSPFDFLDVLLKDYNYLSTK